VLRLSAAMPGPRVDRLRREIGLLAALVAAVEVVFFGGYALGGVARASAGVKLAYTVLWTGVTLAVVLPRLTRIRSIRRGR
jgi:hypothetical protein